MKSLGIFTCSVCSAWAAEAVVFRGEGRCCVEYVCETCCQSVVARVQATPGLDLIGVRDA